MYITFNSSDMTTAEQLKYKGSDPGAVRYGNFINYYSFYPPNERIERLPKHIWNTRSILQCLDVGCNTGELTNAFSDFLLNCGYENKIIGIDIDAILIKRAEENHNQNTDYLCADIMSSDGYNLIKTHLQKLNLEKFQVVTCFSVTMWIHLNHGDVGLETFLERLSNISELLVIESQPWKCYRNAVKRMKKYSYNFQHFPSLKYRENVVKDIQDILTGKCNRVRIFETDDTKWGRKTTFFR